MNEYQVTKQLRKLLRDATWAGSANKVFPHDNSVIATASMLPGAVPSLMYPAITITPSGSSSDPEEPDLVTTDFTFTLIVEVVGDEFGETALVGGMRADTTSSPGRGLLEVQEEALNAVKALGDVDGVSIIARQTSAIVARTVGEQNYVLMREFTVEVTTTNTRFYHPARNFAAADATGGDASLTWALPPTGRFDYNEMIIRRASGSTAPSSSTDGDGVTITNPDTDTSVTDSPGAGTFSYAIFGAYIETGGSTNERFSDSETATVTVT